MLMRRVTLMRRALSAMFTSAVEDNAGPKITTAAGTRADVPTRRHRISSRA